LYAGLPGYACTCIPAIFTSLSVLLPIELFDALAAASAISDADNPDPRACMEAEGPAEGDVTLGLEGNVTDDGDGEGNGEAADSVMVVVEPVPASDVTLSVRGFNEGNDPIPEQDPSGKLEACAPKIGFDGFDTERCRAAALLP